jgi:rod shape-determining protein MreC
MTARTLAWTGFLAAAAFLLMAASRLTVLDPVQEVTFDVTSPLQRSISDVTRPVADWVDNLTEASALSSENHDLRADNERLTAEVARLREEEAVRQQLTDLDAVRAQFPADTFVDARVVGRDTTNVQSMIAIGRGASDGVREGMIVVTEGRTLVGTISRTFDDYAWVTLIDDPSSAVSALVQETRAEGVVAGAYDGGLTMEFVGQGALVGEGDFVVTSGVGGGYPPGVVIGRVGEVSTRGQDLFQSVSVESLATIGALEHVLVMTSFVPVDIASP